MTVELRPLADVGPCEIVSAAALLPGFHTPSPSDLWRALQRIPEVGYSQALREQRLRPRHVRRIAREDPDVFGRYLTQALAVNATRAGREQGAHDLAEGPVAA